VLWVGMSVKLPMVQRPTFIRAATRTTDFSAWFIDQFRAVRSACPALAAPIGSQGAKIES
jgi:hypothetical protein